MPLKRQPDWRERFARMLESEQELRFEWGVFDCALQVCNGINAITGVDPGAPYRGKYSDQAGAAAIYGSNFQLFVESMCNALEMPEVPVNFARRGDVVFIDNDTDQGAVAIVSLDGRFAACAGDQGMTLVPIGRWKRAWQVG